MKRLHCGLLLLSLIVCFCVKAQYIYVSPQGNDAADGSSAQPYATVSQALRKAREWRRLQLPIIKSGIHIIVQQGTYRLSEPVFIRPEDCGTPASPTIIEAAPGASPIMSGGVKIQYWKKLNAAVKGLSSAAQKNIWVADVSSVTASPFLFRQLWINNRKAIRAKQTTGENMFRIRSWNKKTQTCVIPKPAQQVQQVQGMEFFIHQWWAIAMLRVKSLQVQGDSAIVSFHQPESRIQSEHPWPAPWISSATGNSAFFLSNAIEFLDEPGEWYLDVSKQLLYYWPRKGEEMNSAEVIAPFTETLLNIQGTADHPVSNIIINGLQWQHTAWLRPSFQGHVPHQAGLYMTDAYRLKPTGTVFNPNLDNQAWIGRPSAAIQLNYIQSVEINNCRLQHLASTGIDANKGIHALSVNGNLLKDIGGNAILAGVYSDAATEIHLPYHPNDEREVCDSLSITNNLITDATNEDWSGVGIGVGYSRNTIIAHNEVENVSYTGISMGWGWSAHSNAMRNNRISHNYIHHYGKHNYDCAGIYTLSAQPGSEISENRIDSIFKAPYAHLPSHWFYLYTDEGSSYFTVKDNWTPSDKFLRNANGPGNNWINNGPQVNRSVYNNAGIENPFAHLITERTAASLHLPVNEAHHEMIELVVKKDSIFDSKKLQSFLKDQQLDTNALYQWKGHYVLYCKVADIAVLEARLINRFPELNVKVYHDLFYAFRKKNNCADTTLAKEWTHIILTANLVADVHKQQEYLTYHATQLEKWPEVSQGFCNAGFQELLLFKNGRQLMLVISIPKGVRLDDINPKTTANNPRMVEWNNIMKQYQEGIEGTGRNETWVFMQPIN